MGSRGTPRSLERHLARALGYAIAVVGLIAGGVSFVLAYVDAQDLQDDILRQIADLARLDESSFASKTTLADPGTLVVVARLDSPGRPAWLPAETSAGFHTMESPQGAWRIYVQDSQQRGRIAAMQSTEVRNEIVMDSAARTVVPFVLLTPLLVWLASRIVRREFTPLREVAGALDHQPADHAGPVEASGLPREIAPFAQAINRLLERVGRLMEAQRRFVADAAHELRSPLAALSLQAQNLERASTIETARERIAPLRSGIERARRLTEQLLSHAASQAARMQATEVRIAGVVRELLAEHLPHAELRQIDLGMAPSDEAMSVRADRNLLYVVLKNALDNSLRYTPQGGEVTMRCFADGKDAAIEIADTGPGIPAPQRNRVFEAFRRLEGSPGDGSGLGLAIAHDAATRLGATVSLRERPGGGLIFQYRQALKEPLDG